MTLAAIIHIKIMCPVHAEKCGYQLYSPVQHALGSILGLCEKCGYQTEISRTLGVSYRRLDDASVFMTAEEFERGRK